MGVEIEVSAIIPTYNRSALVTRAVRSVLAQTRPVQQVIVVDDGSTDGTAEALTRSFGDRIELVRQTNAGVSAARNRGLRLATGRYIAFLDSDDQWEPDKTRVQLEWFAARPDFGMCLCDVTRTDEHQREFDVLRRRDALPVDGDVLRWVLLNPALVPASVMMRRALFESIGGFDENLATGEDLDFHLRVAAQWKIGVVEQALARVTRGHDGLSALDRTYDDYVIVVERAVAAAASRIAEVDRRRALARAYTRNARGMVHLRRWTAAWRMARHAWANESGAAGRARLGLLLPLAARRMLATLRGHP